jgi:hypothetical protein
MSNVSRDANSHDDEQYEAPARFQSDMDELGILSPAEYGSIRANLADRYNLPLAFLDKEYEERRKAHRREGDPAQSKGPADDKPHPEPVKLGPLLELLTERMRSHVAFTENQALAVALWAVFTWTHDAFTHSPQLLVTSVEANSGKSTLLGLVGLLARKGLQLISPSPAVTFRIIEAWHPTLICDEADDQFKDNPDLRSVFNSGWTRGSGVPRCHPETNEPEIFHTFCPKAIGMKGKRIPDTTLSRCIVVEMKRKKPGTNVKDFDHLDDERLASTRRLMARWARDNINRLRTTNPTMPEGFENRLRANWRPLLAIAELAGADWAKAARNAAIELSHVDQGSIGTTLLADIKTTFEAAGRARLSGEEIVTKLHAMEDRPWAEWGRAHKPMSKHQLAHQLKEFGVCPERINIDGTTLRGYEKVAFGEAWERYLIPPQPQSPLSRVSECHKRDEIRTSATFQSVRAEDDLTLQKCEKPNNDGLGGTLTLWNTPSPVGRVCDHCRRPGSLLVEASIAGVTSFGHEACIAAAAATQQPHPLDIPDYLKRNIGGAR